MDLKRKRKAIKPPTEEQWVKHKNLLRNLYFELTLSKLMEHMEREHNFIASKNQYERKLNKDWNFKKNLTSAEWEHVLRKKHGRDVARKQTQVTLNSMEISKKKIMKEEGRHTLSKLNEIYSSYPMAPSPEGICIFTPRPTFIDTIPIRIENLPCFGLADFLTSQNLFAMFFEPLSSSPSSAESSSLMLKGWSMETMQNNSVSRSPRESITGSINISESLLKMSESVRKPTIITQLRNQTIERYEGEMEARVEMILGNSTNDALSQFLRFFVEFASNDMLDDVQTTHILEWIAQQSDLLLRQIFATQLPSVQACLDLLMNRAAIPLHSAAFKALFLADVNLTLYRGNREALLYNAVKLDLIDIVRRMLTEEDLDVNALLVSNESKFPCQTILSAATTSEMVKLLLDNEADIEAPTHWYYGGWWVGPVVYSAATKCNSGLLQALLAAGAAFNPNQQFQFLGYSLWHPEPELKMRIPFLAAAIQEKDIITLRLLLERGTECTNHVIWRRSRENNNDGVIRLATDLHQAVHFGFTEAVRLLLEIPSGKAALCAVEYCSWVLLRDAAREGHLEIAELLIKAGADVNASSGILTPDHFWWPNGSGNGEAMGMLPSTALLAAIVGDHVEIVELLIRRGVNVNVLEFNVQGSSALAVAKVFGRYEIASLLVGAGAKDFASQSSPPNVMSIWIATIRNDLNMVRKLIRLGVNVGNVLDAMEVGDGYKSSFPNVSNINVLSVFMETCGYEINAKGPRSGCSALELAIQTGDKSRIRDLVDRGADLNQLTSQDFTIIECALYNGMDFELVRFLLERGALANRHGLDESLERAAGQNDVRMMQLLLQHEPEKNADMEYFPRQPAFFTAITHSCLEGTTFLLDKGADVNACAADWNGTPLQIAVSRDSETDIKIIQLLLNNGANVNAPAGGRRGMTALQAAVAQEDADMKVIQLLLDKEAEVNAPGAISGGRTALQAAVEKSHLNSIHLLLDNGADVNAPPADSSGITALQGAAINGDLKIAQILLERGANPNSIKSRYDGRTALEGAAEQGRLDMVRLLLNVGARPSRIAIRRAEENNFLVIADMIRAERVTVVDINDESEDESDFDSD